MEYRCIQIFAITLAMIGLQPLVNSIQQFFFCPRIDLYGRIYRTDQTPSSVGKDVSKADCALDCMSSKCDSFDFDSSSNECSVYEKQPANFILANGSKTNYEFREMADPNKFKPVGSSQPGVPAANCSLPFTYFGQLFLQCTQIFYDAGKLCTSFACMVGRRIWVPCFQGIESPYIVHNIAMNLTIPTFQLPTLVTSVNNWLVIQQRIDGSTPFNRMWQNYRDGFGSFDLNFWFGLEKVYQLTKSSSYRLRLEFQLLNGTWLSAEYDTFYLDGEAANYILHVSGFSGDSGDVLNAPDVNRVHNGMQFSTRDRDNDQSASTSCVVDSGGGGGFWFNFCSWFRINGVYDSESFCMSIAVGGCAAQLATSRMMMKAV